MDTSNLRRVAAASAGVVTVLQAATAVVAVRTGRRDYADGVWGPGLAAVALTSAAVDEEDSRYTEFLDGDPRRRLLARCS